MACSGSARVGCVSWERQAQGAGGITEWLGAGASNSSVFRIIFSVAGDPADTASPEPKPVIPRLAMTGNRYRRLALIASSALAPGTSAASSSAFNGVSTVFKCACISRGLGSTYSSPVTISPAACRSCM